MVTQHDDVAARFGASLRWFDQSGIPFHVMEFLVGHPASDQVGLASPRPVSVLGLVVRCSPEQIPASLLVSYIDRAVGMTGAVGVLTYRHSCDQPAGRALRHVVDEVCHQRGLPVWIRDRHTPPAPQAPLRPIKVPPSAAPHSTSVPTAAPPPRRAS